MIFLTIKGLNVMRKKLAAKDHNDKRYIMSSNSIDRISGVNEGC